MKFKDIIASDNLNVFINSDEFAEPIEIDGQTINVIIDDDRLQKRMEAEYGGITTGTILYFAPVASFGNKPKRGGVQVFDKKYMVIEDIKENDGMYEIIIKQDRSE